VPGEWLVRGHDRFLKLALILTIRMRRLLTQMTTPFIDVAQRISTSAKALGDALAVVDVLASLDEDGAVRVSCVGQWAKCRVARYGRGPDFVAPG